MIETKDLIQIGVLGVAVIASYVKLQIQFERHEKEDEKEYKEIDDTFDSHAEQLKAIYLRINAVEIKQATYDENSKHTTEALKQIFERLGSIESMLRARRGTDA